MKKIRVLILCPPPTENGGVAHYYSLVKKYFTSDSVNIEFNYTGKEYNSKKTKNRLFKSFRDLILLSVNLLRYDLVVINPSLDYRAVVRDGTFHCLSKYFYRRKTIVFFRGWELKVEKNIDRHWRGLFKFIFNADKILVLSNSFKEKLVHWGFNSEVVFLETTTYEKFEISSKKNIFNIIYLSRFAQGKGCLEAVQAIEMLVNEYPTVKLFMVGDGPLASELKEYVDRHCLENHVEFTGWLEGNAKAKILSQCGIMLYPTCYGEGMPNSLLEGMGYGQALVTRPVAGIQDIFVDGINGFLIDSMQPSDFSKSVKYLFQNMSLWVEICETNQQKAEVEYEIRNVVKRLEQLYFEVA
jgi:glycosyltransferase involved in cell wall biosynthesis